MNWKLFVNRFVAVNMIVALLLVHTGQFFTLNDTGGWALELQAMYLGTAVVLVLIGAGRYSIGGAGGRCGCGTADHRERGAAVRPRAARAHAEARPLGEL